MLKKNPLRQEDFREFMDCYDSWNKDKRKETWSDDPHTNPGSEGRWRKYTYDEVMARDKTNLDIVWPKGKSLADQDNHVFRIVNFRVKFVTKK